MSKKEKKPYPVLYVTDAQGTLYHHCSVNPTLYFDLIPNAERCEEDPYYKAYIEDVRENEMLQAIVNKFILSQPLIVTNDHIRFVIFKGNIDKTVLQLFLKAMVDELEFTTKTPIVAKSGIIDSIFMEIGKRPTMLKVGKIGEKLSRTDFVEKECTILEGDHKEEDAGVFTPYDFWLRCKKEEENKSKEEEEEEIVTW